MTEPAVAHELVKVEKPGLPATIGPALSFAQPPPKGTGIRPTVLAGLVLIALFFGGFGGWAALAPIESASVAPGVVSVATNRKTIQHLEGGIVGEILVSEGEKVAAGQTLIRLDDTQPRATLELLRDRRAAALALEARLVAERDGRDAIDFDDSLLAQRESPKVAEMLAAQRNIFAARRKSLSSQIAILGQRVAQYREEIKGLEGEIAAQDAQLALIKEESDTVGMLVKKGLAQKPRLLALLRQAAEIEGGRSRNRAAIARARQNIGEARLRVAELRTSMLNEVVQDLRDVQGERVDLDERIRAAEDVMARTDIRAPLDGTIVSLLVHTPGGVITPGAPLMDIVPEDDKLIVEARVNPNDIDVVHPGLSARVRLSAFSQRNFKPLEGRVISVSADRLTDEQSGQPYYLARVELIGDVHEALNGASLYPGMQAEVMIVTGARTPFEYLTKPVATSLRRAFRED